MPALQAIEARTRTNNKFKPHVTPGPGNGSQAPRWETSALTTVPSQFLHIIARLFIQQNKRWLIKIKSNLTWMNVTNLQDHQHEEKSFPPTCPWWNKTVQEKKNDQLEWLRATVVLRFDQKLPLKSKMAATIFAENILSTPSPKLRLLCRL